LRAWFDRFTKPILAFGYQHCNQDHTLFLKKNEGKITILVIYVDHMIVMRDEGIQYEGSWSIELLGKGIWDEGSWSFEILYLELKFQDQNQVFFCLSKSMHWTYSKK